MARGTGKHALCEPLLTRPSSNQQLAILFGEVKLTAATAAFYQPVQEDGCCSQRAAAHAKLAEGDLPARPGCCSGQPIFISPLVCCCSDITHMLMPIALHQQTEHLWMMLRGEKLMSWLFFAEHCGFEAPVWAPLRPTINLLHPITQFSF